MSKPDASDITYAAPVMAASGPFELHPPHQAEVIRVHDGDTALFRVHFEAGVSTELWIRLEGLNTPELHGPHPEAGKAATNALADLLASGPIWIKLTGDMTFARYVGRVYVIIGDKPIDASEALARYNVTQGQ